MTFDEYMERALEEDEELKKEFIALQPEYERIAEQLQVQRSLQANCTESRRNYKKYEGVINYGKIN